MIGAFLLFAATATAGVYDTPIRNPFWPVGYKGIRQPITLSPRYPDKAEDESESELQGGSSGLRDLLTWTYGAAGRADDDLWRRAQASLKIGNVCVYQKEELSRTNVLINDNLYESGDLVSVNHNRRRFTWKVLGVGTNATVRLLRMNVRPVDGDSAKLDKKGK